MQTNGVAQYLNSILLRNNELLEDPSIALSETRKFENLWEANMSFKSNTVEQLLGAFLKTFTSVHLDLALTQIKK